MSKNPISGLNLFTYFRQVQDELQKVSWPSRKQTTQKTILVIGVSIAVGAYIGILDTVFTYLTQLIIK